MGAQENRLLGNRYRLGERLGRGGAATVHAAIDLVLGREVAVKLYHPVDNRNGFYRFGAEARLLASLSHPGLVTLYDVCLEDDEPYLVMQLVRGTTLREVIDDDGPMDPTEVARLGARLADVLAHIHARDIVHRDLKPSNVLIDRSGTCFLADFGIARALGAAHLTASGEFVGTAAYLAPEQVTDVDTGPAVDVYALGLMLLECLTGETEYTGTTVETALARLSRRPRVPVDLPLAWRAALTAMTAQDPADRPDATRCAQLLTAIVEAREAPKVRHRRLANLPRPRPLHAGLTAAAVAAALTALMFTATTTITGTPVGEPEQVDSQPTTQADVLTGATPTQSADTGPVTPTTTPPPAPAPATAGAGPGAEQPAGGPPADKGKPEKANPRQDNPHQGNPNPGAKKPKG